jgi:uncharacterized protein DUF2510
VNTEPQRVIRRYLDEHGGSVQVPAHNLLTTWAVQDFEGGNRERIAQALHDAGIQTDPPLSDIQLDSIVTLEIRERADTPSPPWEEAEEKGKVAGASEGASPAPVETPAVLSPAGATPPGWYPNPQGPGQRYWDGTQWTSDYTQGPPVQEKKKRRGGTMLKVTLGVFLGGCLLIAGCVALLAGGVNEAAKKQDETAITLQQFRDVPRGSTKSEVIDQVGVDPGDVEEFENEGLPGRAVKGSCIYYNEKGKGLGEGRYFQFCFDNGKLTGKNAY